MLTMETKSQGTMPPNQVGPSNKSSDPGLVMPPQVHNPGQQHPIPLPNQPRQQLLSQNIQNNIASQPNFPPVSSLSLTPIQNVGQNPNMQNIPGQNSMGSSISQNSNMQNMFAGSQRLQLQVVPQQQQQQSQNPQQQLYRHNVPGLQAQQVLAPQSSNSAMQTSQHSAHVLQQSKVSIQLQSQQNASNMLPNQAQPSQPHAPQQQLMPQLQSQPAQMQQQLGLQQQPNPLQRDMQQRLQGSGLQQPSVLDQQKQLYQSQRALPETSSTSLDSTAQTGQPNGGDWQEEVYQKIKTMKENYMPELNEMYQKIVSKLQQHDSLPQQPKSDQLEKLRVFKMMMERVITFLQVSKSNILPNYREKLGSYEKQIINFISTNRPRKTISSLQQPGQLPPPHMHSMSHSQPQFTQAQCHENQMNSQLQTTNIQGSVGGMPQNNMASMQHNSLSGVPTTQQTMMNSMQTGTNLDSGQGNAVNSLQQQQLQLRQQQQLQLWQHQQQQLQMQQRLQLW